MNFNIDFKKIVNNMIFFYRDAICIRCNWS